MEEKFAFLLRLSYTKMVKKLLTLFLSLITFHLSLAGVQPAYAAENFTTAYDVEYAIDESGMAHVTMQVDLTNTSSQYYASSYKIHLGFDEIENVKVQDPNGEVTPVVKKTDEGHEISVTFNKRVVGKGNTLPFTVTFDTKDVAKNRGSSMSVNIPGIAEQEGFSEFAVDVVVPSAFGPAAFIKPIQENNELHFSKEQLGSGGISLAFGEKQAYNFYLTYHLRNRNVFPIKTEIALPPTTNYQDVYFSSIEPKPVNVTRDRDGNWLASYELLPSQRFDVIVRGKAYLSLTPKKQKETEANLRAYLKEDDNWQTSDKRIQELAKKLKTPEAIYDHVVSSLEYDFSRVTENKPRLGAVGVLENPTSAVCLEFTDLFIAIARAAGIPAREVNGYAFTENDRQRPLSLVKDILHAWPEYYDHEKETWIMIDPTWGNTTEGIDYFSVFDYDHFTFVRKGIDSEYPVPAGGYKFSATDEGKDVHVEFGDLEVIPTEVITITSEFKEKNLTFLPLTGSVHLSNTGQGMTKPQEMRITSTSLTPGEQIIMIPAIPPYGSVDIPITFENMPLLTNETHTATIQVAGRDTRVSLTIVPVIIPAWPILGGLFIGSSIIIIFIFAFKTGRVPLFRRK